MLLEKRQEVYIYMCRVFTVLFMLLQGPIDEWGLYFSTQTGFLLVKGRDNQRGAEKKWGVPSARAWNFAITKFIEMYLKIL